MRLVNSHHIELNEVRELPFETEVVCELVNFERALLRQQYKFGVLLSAGDASEDDLFANRSGTENYKAFLQFVGRSVLLSEHKGFMGGLQRKNGVTGTHSVATSLEGCDVMYHVSTMLPFSGSDKQQLERKRHLGNGETACSFAFCFISFFFLFFSFLFFDYLEKMPA